MNINRITTKFDLLTTYGFHIMSILFVVLISSCSTTKNTGNKQVNDIGEQAIHDVDEEQEDYKDFLHSSNKVYRKLVSEYAETLKDRTPIALVVDSVTTIPNKWHATVNFNMRKPNFIMLHHTAQDSCAQTLKTFSLKKNQVSSHYLVCKGGDVYTLCNDYLRTWHAGAGKWGNVIDMNSSAIGIEIDNNGSESFTENQINSLIVLLDSLQKKYNIPKANFIAHSDFAPKRKQDPSVYFPWSKLAECDFGYWRDDILITPPADFNFLHALKMIGYDISNEAAAIVAFKRHFVQNNIDPVLTEYDKKVVYNIWKKFMGISS